MSPEELEAALQNAKHEMFNMRFQRRIGQLPDPNRISAVKHEIARLLTVRRERELWAEYEASVSGANEDTE